MVFPNKAEPGDAIVRVIRKAGTISELIADGRALIDWEDGSQSKVHLEDVEYAKPQSFEKIFGRPFPTGGLRA